MAFMSRFILKLDRNTELARAVDAMMVRVKRICIFIIKVNTFFFRRCVFLTEIETCYPCFC